MKELLKSIFVIGFFAISTILSAQKTYNIPKAVTKDHNQIIVGVFPQVELISIVQTIGKYQTALDFLMARDTSIYKTDVINHFDPYKDHPVVLMFDRLSLQPRMLNFSAPSNIMLYTDESLELRSDITLDDFVINRAGGIDSLRLFLGLLRDFAVKSSFNDFFQTHHEFYLTIAENTINNMGSINYISELENFFGQTQKSYNIILVSLYNFVGFGNSLLFSDGKREIYNTMGPTKVLNNIPFFGDENYLKYMIRHECCHPFINPMTEKYWDYIKDYSHNYDSIPDIARKNVCGDWQECINEFVIRAITTQIAFNESDSIGLLTYKKEKSRGVSYLDDLLDRIKLFQLKRDTFPTFESFYPNILDVFKKQ